MSLAFWLYQSGLIINITGSMPRGIYWRETGKIHRGDLVTFCLSEKHQKFGLERGYLINGMRCQFSEPLIKKVIAIPGDNVILASQFIVVNDQSLPYKTLSTDSKDRPLRAYPAGVYTNTKNYWVIGTNSKRSWDSRYFGPIPQKSILWKIKPVLVYHNDKATNKHKPKQCTLVFDNKITLNHVPLAETLAQQEQGLSGKANTTNGMFFTFSHPKRVSFWMKNTSKPLSIGFFDNKGVLVSIENMEPNTKKLYFSADDAKYALELPQGQFEKIGFKLGNRLLKRTCY